MDTFLGLPCIWVAGPGKLVKELQIAKEEAEENMERITQELAELSAQIQALTDDEAVQSAKPRNPRKFEIIEGRGHYIECIRHF